MRLRFAEGLAVFADARGSQTEAPTVDLIGDYVLVKGLADCRIQSFQQLRERFSLASHETGEERLIVDGDDRAPVRGV